MKFNVFDIDYGDDKVIRFIIDKLIDKNEAYEEIILALTSNELDTIEEVIAKLGYDNSIYVSVKNKFKDLTNLI